MGERSPTMAAQVKLALPKMATKIALDAIQLHGGYGYSREFPLERMMRDNKLNEIGAGTNEVMILIIAKNLLGEIIVNELQKELKNQLTKFRLQEIEPHMETDDHAEHFRMNIFTKLGELGFTGMTLPEDFGGAGLGYTDLCIALTELAKSSVSYAVTVSVSTMVQATLNQFGNDKQKKLYLPALTSGNEIGAFCLSESSSGSDAAALKDDGKKS